MPVIFGDSLAGWVIRLIAAVFVFLFVQWAIPLLLHALGIPVPEQLVTVFALLVAALVLFGNLWWGRVTTKPAP
jgi:phage-related holin